MAQQRCFRTRRRDAAEDDVSEAVACLLPAVPQLNHRVNTRRVHVDTSRGHDCKHELGGRTATCMQKTPFVPFFLCLSRACLDKCSVSSIKWRHKEGVFRTSLRVLCLDGLLHRVQQGCLWWWKGQRAAIAAFALDVVPQAKREHYNIRAFHSGLQEAPLFSTCFLCLSELVLINGSFSLTQMAQKKAFCRTIASAISDAFPFVPTCSLPGA